MFLLPAYLLTFSYLFTCLPVYLFTCLPVYIPAYSSPLMNIEMRFGVDVSNPARFSVF